jgi:hypothetical protein
MDEACAERREGRNRAENGSASRRWSRQGSLRLRPPTRGLYGCCCSSLPSACGGYGQRSGDPPQPALLGLGASCGAAVVDLPANSGWQPKLLVDTVTTGNSAAPTLAFGSTANTAITWVPALYSRASVFLTAPPQSAGAGGRWGAAAPTSKSLRSVDACCCRNRFAATAAAAGAAPQLGAPAGIHRNGAGLGLRHINAPQPSSTSSLAISAASDSRVIEPPGFGRSPADPLHLNSSAYSYQATLASDVIDVSV